MTHRSLRVPTVLLLGAVTSAAAIGQDLGVSIDLPDGISWTLATDQVAGDSYSREWVPAGEEPETAKWLIAQQKVPVADKTDAEKFLQHIYELTGEACRSATHDEIEHMRIDRVRAAIGRTMCGQRLGTDYGVFADRTVLVEDGFAYVITSEIRIAPMIVDGVLSFGNVDDPKARVAKEKFMEREQQSRSLVRDHVHID